MEGACSEQETVDSWCFAVLAVLTDGSIGSSVPATATRYPLGFLGRGGVRRDAGLLPLRYILILPPFG